MHRFAPIGRITCVLARVNFKPSGFTAQWAAVRGVATEVFQDPKQLILNAALNHVTTQGCVSTRMQASAYPT